MVATFNCFNFFENNPVTTRRFKYQDLISYLNQNHNISVYHSSKNNTSLEIPCAPKLVEKVKSVENVFLGTCTLTYFYLVGGGLCENIVATNFKCSGVEVEALKKKKEKENLHYIHKHFSCCYYLNNNNNNKSVKATRLKNFPRNSLLSLTLFALKEEENTSIFKCLLCYPCNRVYHFCASFLSVYFSFFTSKIG